MEITSIHNEKVKEAAKLLQKKYRDKNGQFLIEDDHLIFEAAKENLVVTVFALAEVADLYEQFHPYIVTHEILDKLSSSASGCKAIAVCKKKNISRKSNRILLLDGVQDPGNMGTILRTATSFGFDKVIMSKDSCDVYNAKCLRSTEGALFHLDIERTDLVFRMQQLKQEGYMLVATALRNSVDLKQLNKTEKMAIIMGNEGNGVSNEVLDASDICVKIEMNQFESLNVAIAAGIMMYECKGN